jgi:iron complex transport system substrate-binding protein
MKSKIIKLLLLLSVLFPNPIRADVPQRVVSLAPALTEMIYYLQAGDRLVGSTRFCDYPPQALKTAKVGGLFDLNLEILSSLKPDLILLYPEQAERVSALSRRSRILSLPHSSLDDIWFSLREIGQALGLGERGAEKAANLRRELQVISAGKSARRKRSVLLVAGRDPDRLRNMTLIGSRDFLNELLACTGLENAYSGEIPYPQVSMESIIYMNPDLIIELSAFYEGISEERIQALWREFSLLKAVHRDRVKIIRESFWLRPGPRVVEIAAALAALAEDD